jgi:hypothetical protein
MSQKNSFISILEQLAILNKNAVEVLTKMNDTVSSKSSSVSLNITDETGQVSTYEMPTVGFLKNELDIANSNIKKLAALDSDNSVIIIENNSSRKIKSVDLNREPSQVSTINTVSSFSQANNWFFESLMNPLLNIKIDLTDKIDDNVSKILSRRYIIKFEKNDDGTLTNRGNTSYNTFKSQFLNRNDFSIDSFLKWLNSSTNLGVANSANENQYMDEQIFSLDYREINYKGIFSVSKIETDKINNKIWYHLNSITYYGKDGSTKLLTIGDEVILTKKNSFSKYKVREINTSSSLFRIGFDRVEGYDPIPIGSSVLEYYYPAQLNKEVKVTIGFDEYNVIFIRPINTDTNIISGSWSKGMSFYTNDLVLDTDSNIGMSDFYLNNVFDYGALLKDLVVKKIPSSYGAVPNYPQLLSDNFKVVQINKHLTDTKDYKTLKNLHSQKNVSKSKLEQLNEAIIEKNKELSIKVYKSVAEKSQSQNELDKLIKKQESETKLYSSIVAQISNSKAEVSTDPKFRIRGFWDMPDAIIKTGYKPQEVVGFEIQYRYSSKFSGENPTEGFEVKRNNTTSTINNQNGTVLGTKTTTGYFSNWIPLKTDIRQREYDNVKGEWYWEIEDISDADTPNINQLDIPIQANEKVEIKIRSISEVGYPETPLYSEWSEILTVEFPDDLKNILGENEFILKEASQEEIKVQFDNELNAKGLIRHASESFYVNEQYYAHTDKIIATSFKDTNGNTLSLFDYLKSLDDKINVLQETIKRTKGELKVTLYRNTDENIITNNSTLNITINCENYAIYGTGTTITQRTKEFKNNIYAFKEVYLKFENIATENAYGLISDRTLESINTQSIIGKNRATFIDKDGILRVQVNNQYLWLKDREGQTNLLYDGTGSTSVGGNNLVKEILSLNDKNIGDAFKDINILENNIWYDSTAPLQSFIATVHPYVSSIDDLTTTSEDGIKIIKATDSFKIPIILYFKLDGSKENDSIISIDTAIAPKTLSKKLIFYLEPENSNKPFTFNLIFNLNRHNKAITQSTQVTTIQNSTQ